MPEFQLDFDQVALVGRASRHRPTFLLSQLDAAAREHRLVSEYARFHHDAWYLPLVEAHVRAWLKTLRFSTPPAVTVSGVQVPCGRELEVPDG